MSNETCPKCGAIYEVTEVKTPWRDQDSYECNCGHQMDKWSGSTHPVYKLVTPGKVK